MKLDESGGWGHSRRQHREEENLAWILILTGFMGGGGGAELSPISEALVPGLAGGHCIPTAALVLPGLASSSHFCPVMWVPLLGSVPRCFCLNGLDCCL